MNIVFDLNNPHQAALYASISAESHRQHKSRGYVIRQLVRRFLRQHRNHPYTMTNQQKEAGGRDPRCGDAFPPFEPPPLPDALLLNWIARNYSVILHDRNDVRLEKAHPNEKRADDPQRFRQGLSKILTEQGMV